MGSGSTSYITSNKDVLIKKSTTKKFNLVVTLSLALLLGLMTLFSLGSSLTKNNQAEGFNLVRWVMCSVVPSPGDHIYNFTQSDDLQWLLRSKSAVGGGKSDVETNLNWLLDSFEPGFKEINEPILGYKLDPTGTTDSDDDNKDEDGEEENDNLTGTEKDNKELLERLESIDGEANGGVRVNPFDRFGVAGMNFSAYNGEWKYMIIDACADNDENKQVDPKNGMFYDDRLEPQSVWEDINKSKDVRTVQFSKGFVSQLMTAIQDVVANFIFFFTKLVVVVTITLIGYSFSDVTEDIGMTDFLAADGGLFDMFYNGIFTPMIVMIIVMTGIYIFWVGIVKRGYRNALGTLLKTVALFMFGVIISVNPAFWISIPNKVAVTAQAMIITAFNGSLPGQEGLCQTEVAGQEPIKSKYTVNGDKEVEIINDDNKDVTSYDGALEGLNEAAVNIRSAVGCSFWQTLLFKPWTEGQFGTDWYKLFSANKTPDWAKNEKYESAELNNGPDNQVMVGDAEVPLGGGYTVNNWALYQLSTQTNVHVPTGHEGERSIYTADIANDWWRIVDAMANYEEEEVTDILASGIRAQISAGGTTNSGGPIKNTAGDPSNNFAAIPDDVASLINKAADTCEDLDPSVMASILNAESGFQEKPDYSAIEAEGAETQGASGIAAMTDPAWDTYGEGGDRNKKEDAIPASARMMCDQLQKIKQLKAEGKVEGDDNELLAASYNSGLGAVEEAGGVPSGGDPNDINSYEAQTKPYVDKVIKGAKVYAGLPANSGDDRTEPGTNNIRNNTTVPLGNSGLNLDLEAGQDQVTYQRPKVQETTPYWDDWTGNNALNRVMVSATSFFTALAVVILPFILGFMSTILAFGIVIIMSFAPIMIMFGCWPGPGMNIFKSWLELLVNTTMKRIAIGLLMAVSITLIMKVLSFIGDTLSWWEGMVLIALIAVVIWKVRGKIFDIFASFKFATSGGINNVGKTVGNKLLDKGKLYGKNTQNLALGTVSGGIGAKANGGSFFNGLGAGAKRELSNLSFRSNSPFLRQARIGYDENTAYNNTHANDKNIMHDVFKGKQYCSNCGAELEITKMDNGTLHFHGGRAEDGSLICFTCLDEGIDPQALEIDMRYNPNIPEYKDKNANKIFKNYSDIEGTTSHFNNEYMKAYVAELESDMRKANDTMIPLTTNDRAQRLVKLSEALGSDIEMHRRGDIDKNRVPQIPSFIKPYLDEDVVKKAYLHKNYNLVEASFAAALIEMHRDTLIKKFNNMSDEEILEKVDKEEKMMRYDRNEINVPYLIDVMHNGEANAKEKYDKEAVEKAEKEQDRK